MVTVNWSDPKLRHCVALITTFDGRPERHYPSGRVERLSVDNSSSSISQTPAHIGSGRYSSEFAGSATIDDGILLGSITSADPISFFGKTAVSVVSRCSYTRASSLFPRIIDKSSAPGSLPDGWGFYMAENDDILRFGIDGSFLGQGVVDAVNDSVRTLAMNATNIPLSGSATVLLRTFVNGAELDAHQNTLPPFPATTTAGKVGGISDRQWRGNIEYVALFDKPLSDAEHLAFDRNGYSFFGSRQLVYSVGSSAEEPPVDGPTRQLYHHRFHNNAA